MTRRSQLIAATFGKVSTQYGQKAQLQQYAAQQLATKMARLPMPENPRVLELGCGSGLLSHYLVKHRPKGTFLFTDASQAMVLASQEQLTANPTHSKRWFAVMNGEQPAVAPGFDLIAAGLTWQWFEDPCNSIKRITDLLNPGGWLALSTLGEKTFQEWRTTCALANLPCGAMTHPSRADWEQSWPPGGQGLLEEENLTLTHSSALEFLQSLHAIGANRPAPNHRPVTGGALRRVLRLNQHEFPIRYQIFYLFFSKEGSNNSPCIPLDSSEAK